MSEMSSLSSSSSLSTRDFNTLSLTGSNVLMNTKPTNTIKSMKKSHSQPELPTIQEMVNVRTKKESVWGIPHYNVPKFGANLTITKRVTMAPRCNDGLIDSFK